MEVLRIKAYDELKELVQVFTLIEFKIAREYLMAFDKKSNNNPSNYLLLLNDIIHNKTNNCQTIFLELTTSGNRKSFSMLCYRLRDKLLETLILEVNINRLGNISALGKADIDCEKLMLKAKIAATRGKLPLALSLLSRLLSIAHRYELYPKIVEVLKARQIMLGLRYGSRVYNKLQAEIKHYSYCQESVELGQIYSSQLHNIMAFRNSLVKLNAKKPLKDLKNRYKKTQSKELYYMWQEFQSELQQYEKEYEKSNTTLFGLLKFIKDNPLVYKARREGGIYNTLAYNTTFSANPIDSFEYIALATPFFSVNSYNYYQLQCTKFLALFFTDKLPEANALSKALIGHRFAIQTPIQQAKWHYYSAVCAYIQGDYKTVNHHLVQTNSLKKDREGWHFNIRLLKVLTAIDANNSALALEEIDHLRNFYYRKQGLNARQKAILLTLLSLTTNYDLELTKKLHTKSLQKLSAQKGWYKWQSRTPELIIFDVWIEQRAKDIHYHLDNYKFMRKSYGYNVK